MDGDGCDNDCTDSVVTAIDAGGGHTCARLDSGVVRCWGENYFGALGLGNVAVVGDNETPASVPGAAIGVPLAQVAAGSGYTCARTEADGVRCWGLNDNGQLGYGNLFNLGDDELPSTAGDVMVMPGTLVDIDANYRHACAVYASGEVNCWGVNDFGQIGYGNYDTIGDNESPSAAGFVDVPGDVVQIALGERHTCARLATGAVRCWGYGIDGALGYGNQTTIGDTELPSSVGEVPVPAVVESIVTGANHTCALSQGGEVYCWGSPFAGQLGYGNTTPIGDDETQSSPVPVGNAMAGLLVTQIVAGGAHTCALLDGGIVRCWGSGSLGQLGYGNGENIGDDETPNSAGNVDVGGPVAALAAGGAHTCALMVSGAVRCWGWGAGGRLGYGNTNTIGDDETPATAGDVPVF